MNSEELKNKVDKEFCDKLNSLTLEEIFYIICPGQDIKYIHEIGIVSGRYYFTEMQKTYEDMNKFNKENR